MCNIPDDVLADIRQLVTIHRTGWEHFPAQRAMIDRIDAWLDSLPAAPEPDWNNIPDDVRATVKSWAELVQEYGAWLDGDSVTIELLGALKGEALLLITLSNSDSPTRTQRVALANGDRCRIGGWVLQTSAPG